MATTSKKFAVIHKETGISSQYFDTEKEARERARFLTGYHKSEYIVREVTVYANQ